MGEAKRKSMVAPSGVKSGANAGRSGAGGSVPPPILTGGEKEGTTKGDNPQLGSDRYRVNVSLPPAVHRALVGAAAVMGTSVSQVALQAIINGLPTLTTQVAAAMELGEP